MWRDEALERGICFGRQGIPFYYQFCLDFVPNTEANSKGVFGQSPDVPSSSNPFVLKCYEGAVYFLNTTLEDYRGVDDRPHTWDTKQYPFASDQTETLEDGIQHDENLETAPHPTRHLSLTPCNEAGDSDFFSYFVDCMCPNLSNSSTDNPYWEFVVPLSLTSAPLFYALLSWAANEASMAAGSKRHTYRVAAASYKGLALRGLRDEIASAQQDRNTTSGTWASILTTIIMLSASDIAETCSEAWVEHLRAARTLCSIVWPSRPALPDRFRRFCVMWFVSHDIMSRTAWIRQTLFEPSEWFAGEDEREIDPIIACSRGVIQQVSAIGTLMEERRRKGSPLLVDNEDESERRRRNAIEGVLLSLEQRVAARNEGCASTDVLLQVAESKRLCALIYLYACIDHATPSSPIIQGLTRRVIGILTNVPSKPSIIFPLFVAGTLAVCNEDDRRLVLDKFDSLTKIRSLATAVKAQDIVTNVWLERDLGRHRRWEDLVETKSRLLSLA